VSASFGIGYLAGMFGVVAFGAVVPVVPTGAAVSAGAALSYSDHIALPIIVVLVGAAGAYLGDLATYAVLRRAGDGLRSRVRWLRDEHRAAALEQFRVSITRHELRTLLVSRLVPGGRVPVLLAAALGRYPFRRYAVADIAAALLWAVFYAAIGLAGRAVFPEQWEGVVAAIALVLLISLAGSWWNSRRTRLRSARTRHEART
jgi:membrane protein DedA with SNARE-associated domain